MKVIRFFGLIILAFVVPLSILITQTPVKAQNSSPVPQTGQTMFYALGDDGDLQKGVEWPDPRFLDNGDGTVTDNLTGLIWLKNADCFGEKNWNDALAVSNNLANGQCGLTDSSIPGDWHLPNVRELRSLIDHGNPSPALPSGHPFTNVQRIDYWSSTTIANRTDEAWLVVLGFGDLGFGFGQVWDVFKDDVYHVWPVRSSDEVETTTAPVPQTGQTMIYALGDDGDLQKGVEWPEPRFSDNGSGAVKDNLTGLIWLKNADCFGEKNWNDALAVSNNLANGQCGLTDSSIPGDWHLPNVRELLSLIDHSNSSPTLPSGHPFTNVRSAGGEPSSSYWSSTTVANRTDAACLVLMAPEGSALMDDAPKNQDFRGVWPVRNMLNINIDIHPVSDSSKINLKNKGVIPVAIITTDSFDATLVDPLSVEFGPNGALESHEKGHIEDVDNDGDFDIVLHFKTQETGIVCGDTEAFLIGETFDGQYFIGSNNIITLGCKQKHNKK